MSRNPVKKLPYYVSGELVSGPYGTDTWWRVVVEGQGWQSVYRVDWTGRGRDLDGEALLVSRSELRPPTSLECAKAELCAEGAASMRDYLAACAQSEESYP